MEDKNGSHSEPLIATPRTAPPLDGLRAYVVAVAIALSQMCILGAYTSYPTFLEALRADPQFHRPSLTTLAIPSSVVLGMIPLLGVVAGIACDKYGPRPALFSAALFLLLVGILTPFAQSVEVFIVIYTLTMGTAAASIVAPGPAALGTWFSEERVSIGMGIGEAGAALGTSVLPAVGSALVDYYGEWRTPFRIMAAFSAIPFLCLIVVRQRPTGPEEQIQEEAADTVHNGSLNDTDGIEVDEEPNSSLSRCVKTTCCVGLILGQMFFAYGYFSMLFLAIPYAQTFGTAGTVYSGNDPISLQDASLLLTAFGVANAVGAVAMGFLAAKINTLVVFAVAMVVLGALMVTWIFCTHYLYLLIVFGAMGFLCAAGLACLPSMVVKRFMGPHLNTLMSLSFVGFGIGGLCGPFVSSALQNTTTGSFTTSILLAAGSEVLAMATVVIGLQAHARKNW